LVKTVCGEDCVEYDVFRMKYGIYKKHLSYITGRKKGNVK